MSLACAGAKPSPERNMRVRRFCSHLLTCAGTRLFVWGEHAVTGLSHEWAKGNGPRVDALHSGPLHVQLISHVSVMEKTEGEMSMKAPRAIGSCGAV